MLKNPENRIVDKNAENKQADFEAKQNAVGFFSLLLKVAKRNPELWKQICNEKSDELCLITILA